MAGSALLVSDINDLQSKIATVFEFIDYQLTSVDGENESILEELLLNEYSIALLSMSTEEMEKSVISTLLREKPSVPIYLIKNLAETEDELPKGVTGKIYQPVQYRKLLSIIRSAEKRDRRVSRNPDGLKVSLTGNSPQLKEIQALIRHVSMTDANVLLLGESGTGKEVVARAVHHLSLRTDKPFVAVNCGAIPPDLLESELFGHEKGAFTGAISTRKGRFELAEGGTLFLDEIGDMPLPMQVKLLRVLQERCFERVGGSSIMKSNVRLIAATHQDLEKKIGEGKFRMDLFYRLNVFPIELPALRDRSSDIPALINEFSTRMELEHKSPIVFDESAIESLQAHPLPGNVRELENLIERLAILFPGETITREKLPLRYRSCRLSERKERRQEGESISPSSSTNDFDFSNGIKLKEYLASLEKSIIQEALIHSDWVVAKAAKSLALQRTTLVEKIKKLDIQSPS